MISLLNCIHTLSRPSVQQNIFEIYNYQKNFKYPQAATPVDLHYSFLYFLSFHFAAKRLRKRTFINVFEEKWSAINVKSKYNHLAVWQWVPCQTCLLMSNHKKKERSWMSFNSKKYLSYTLTLMTYITSLSPSTIEALLSVVNDQFFNLAFSVITNRWKFIKELSITIGLWTPESLFVVNSRCLKC